MHQIKRTTNFAKKLEILPFFRHAQCNPFTACSFVRECSLGKLEKGEAGKLTECPYYFIPVDFFWVKCVRFSSCHDWEFWNSKCPSDFEDFWQLFSEEFWTSPKMSEDVPANFQSFQSYLKVTILACFDLIMVQSHYSVPSFTAGILFFRGCR